MDFFDDIGKTFTSVATEIFHGVDNATTVIFDANKQALSQLGVDKDSFTNKVLDQWQEKKRVAVGTMLKVAGDGLNLIATGAGAVDKGLNQYLGIQTPLGPIVQQGNLDKVGKLALSAVLEAVKNAGQDAAAAVKTVDNMISGDAKLADLVVATAKAQTS